MPQNQDTTTTTPTTPTTTPLDAFGPEALLRAREEAARIADADLIPIRVGVADAALGAIGSMPAIEAQREAIVRTFGAEGTDAIDAIVPAARAAQLANAAYTASSERDLEPAAKALMETRVRLFTLATAMVARGVVDKKVLERLAGGQAYVALVNDTMALVEWFSIHEEVIRPHSKVTRAELEVALRDAEEFGRILKERDQARVGSAPATQVRARAFTYFVRSYDRLRKLLTFVRWTEGDADLIAPSLYAGRARKPGEAAPFAPPTDLTAAPGMPGADPFLPST